MTRASGLVVGIDASRTRSGGGWAHLRGILEHGRPTEHGIRTVHVWAFRPLLDSLPAAPWLVKHDPAPFEGSLAKQIWWQYRHFASEARDAGCDVVLNTDAGSVGRFHPAVTMSRDMLSYEPGVKQRYGWSKARLRLEALYYIQNASLRRADGAVFLTNYAARVIQRATGQLPLVAVIPHGVSEAFRAGAPRGTWPAGQRVRCLYVSNAAMYKHQWHVVRAFGELRRRGHDVGLTLAGGGSGLAQRLLDQAIDQVDPRREFVTLLGPVPNADIPKLHSDADIFVFASGAENMPNTLVEAMAAGLPIACSDRGPMPEVLGDGGVYFDPENPVAIASAVEKLVTDPGFRRQLAQRSWELSARYSWARCGRETWEFLARVAALKLR